jgi:anti-anti-sigma factor
MAELETYAPTGRLDAQAAPAARQALEALAAAGGRRIVVDLAGVTFLDSSGLGALVAGLKAARARGAELRLAAPGPQVRELLRLTALERVFPIFESVEAAAT